MYYKVAGAVTVHKQALTESSSSVLVHAAQISCRLLFFSTSGNATGDPTMHLLEDLLD